MNTVAFGTFEVTESMYDCVVRRCATADGTTTANNTRTILTHAKKRFITISFGAISFFKNIQLGVYRDTKPKLPIVGYDDEV